MRWSPSPEGDTSVYVPACSTTQRYSASSVPSTITWSRSSPVYARSGPNTKPTPSQRHRPTAATASSKVAHVAGSVLLAMRPFAAHTGIFVALPPRSSRRQHTQRASARSSAGTYSSDAMEKHRPSPYALHCLPEESRQESSSRRAWLQPRSPPLRGRIRPVRRIRARLQAPPHRHPATTAQRARASSPCPTIPFAVFGNTRSLQM